MMKKIAMLMLVLVGVVSCDNVSEEKKIVSVGDSDLTESRLMAALPSNVSVADSQIIAEEFVKRWVQQQVLLQKAQLNLTSDDQDIELAVEEYRTSLIVERYQQKVVASLFNPIIADTAMEAYYEEMKHNFKLHDNIIKGVFAVVPNGVRDIKKIKKILTSDKVENIVELEKYLYTSSSKYEISLDKWMPMSYVRSYMPNDMLKNEVAMLKSKKLIETTDGENTYLLRVLDYMEVDDVSPLDFVKEQIYTILLNKEKIKFIKKMKNDLLNEAHKNNSIKYYNETNR